MERLTERLKNGVINVKYASQHETAIHRLVTIEDILGEEYDLDDVAPVVRCRECKHYQHYGKTSILEDGENVKAGWCYRRIRFDEECRMPADGFCSYGQRKEAEHG